MFVTPGLRKGENKEAEYEGSSNTQLKPKEEQCCKDLMLSCLGWNYQRTGSNRTTSGVRGTERKDVRSENRLVERWERPESPENEGKTLGMAKRLLVQRTHLWRYGDV